MTMTWKNALEGARVIACAALVGGCASTGGQSEGPDPVVLDTWDVRISESNARVSAPRFGAYLKKVKGQWTDVGIDGGGERVIVDLDARTLTVDGPKDGKPWCAVGLWADNPPACSSKFFGVTNQLNPFTVFGEVIMLPLAILFEGGPVFFQELKPDAVRRIVQKSGVVDREVARREAEVQRIAAEKARVKREAEAAAAKREREANYQAGYLAYKAEDWDTALYHLEPLAERGNAAAQSVLSDMYYFGDGVPQDHRRSFELAAKAAEGGDEHGHFRLGYAYYVGHGTEVDYRKAREHYQMSMDLKDKLGMKSSGEKYNLSILYRTGRGGPKDLKRAYTLLSDVDQRDLTTGDVEDQMQSLYKSGTLRYVQPTKINVRQGPSTSTPAIASLKQNAPIRTLWLDGDWYTVAFQEPGSSDWKEGKIRKDLVAFGRVQAPAPVRADNRPRRLETASNDGYPAVPAKRPGVVSCNTRCVNALCFRTYDDGRKVKFTAQQVWDPFTSSFKFDSGGC